MSKWHPFYRTGVHMISLTFVMALLGTLFLWFLLSNKASAAEPDPKCWVCSFKPPEKSEAPPALVIKPPTPPEPDIIPKDTAPGPLFDMSLCGPDKQIIYNCDKFET